VTGPGERPGAGGPAGAWDGRTASGLAVPPSRRPHGHAAAAAVAAAAVAAIAGGGGADGDRADRGAGARRDAGHREEHAAGSPGRAGGGLDAPARAVPPLGQHHGGAVVGAVAARGGAGGRRTAPRPGGTADEP